MQFEQIRETLKQIGLGHNESKIYITLIKLGPSMAGRIAKEANIDRSACYDSLKALNKKGLVNYVLEANRKKFAATNPSRLKEYLKEKESLVDEVLPNLREMFKSKEEKSQVSMYRGLKGLKAVFEDILEEAKGGENLVIDSHGQFREKMPFYVSHFSRGLTKNKIHVRRLVRRSKEKNIHPGKNTTLRF
jgi:sugar-specific transcriptional regulator TrmB